MCSTVQESHVLQKNLRKCFVVFQTKCNNNTVYQAILFFCSEKEMSRSRPSSASISQRPEKKGCCYSLDRFPQLPGGRLRCPVDGGVLRDAVKSKKCGHVFGLQCAIYYSIEHDRCPVCSAAMDCADLEPEEFIREEVNTLRISCAEGPDRCTWSGPLASEAKHKNSPSCGVQRQDCPFCDAKALEVPKEFEAHKLLCAECIVICENCCEDMARKKLAAHSRTCDAKNMPEPLRRQREAAKLAAQHAASSTTTAQKAHYPSSTVAPPPIPVIIAPEIDVDDEEDNDEVVVVKEEAQAEPKAAATTVNHLPSLLSSGDDRLPSRRGGSGEGESQPHPKAPAAQPHPCDLTGMSCPNQSSTSHPHNSIFMDPHNESSVTGIGGKTMDVMELSDNASSEFSPPTPKTAPPSREHSGSPTRGEHVASVPCPFAELGCPQRTHLPHDFASPFFLQAHLQMIGSAFAALRTEHEALKTENQKLHVTVEQQKRSIKMLEVRQAYQGGKLPAAASTTTASSSKASNAGLVDSPRTQTRDNGAAGTGSAPNSQESTPVKRSTTQQHSTGLHRSNSSPAAPSRVGVPRESGGSFVPAAPPKKPTAPPTVRRTSVQAAS